MLLFSTLFDVNFGVELIVLILILEYQSYINCNKKYNGY